MSKFENITGQKLVDLLQELIRAKTLVKLSIDKDFERLTVLLAVNTEKADRMLFQIDPPEGFRLAVQKAHQPILRFEFLSQNRLPHRFDVPFEDSGDEGWLSIPETIKRYQRRSDFRIKAPDSAYATALINEVELKMTLDNISLGGIFCHCPNSVKAFLIRDQIIENLSLVFVLEGTYQMIPIGRAVVRRIEGRTRQRHFGIAFEFAQMDLGAQRNLVQLVYWLQRKSLQNRAKYKG